MIPTNMDDVQPQSDLDQPGIPVRWNKPPSFAQDSRRTLHGDVYIPEKYTPRNSLKQIANHARAALSSNMPGEVDDSHTLDEASGYHEPYPGFVQHKPKRKYITWDTSGNRPQVMNPGSVQQKPKKKYITCDACGNRAQVMGPELGLQKSKREYFMCDLCGSPLVVESESQEDTKVGLPSDSKFIPSNNLSRYNAWVSAHSKDFVDVDAVQSSDCDDAERDEPLMTPEIHNHHIRKRYSSSNERHRNPQSQSSDTTPSMPSGMAHKSCQEVLEPKAENEKTSCSVEPSTAASVIKEHWAAALDNTAPPGMSAMRAPSTSSERQINTSQDSSSIKGHQKHTAQKGVLQWVNTTKETDNSSPLPSPTISNASISNRSWPVAQIRTSSPGSDSMLSSGALVFELWTLLQDDDQDRDRLYI